jgi:ABC-2 type transport system ATP-binding protein
MDHGKILALDTPEKLKHSVGIDTIVTVKSSSDQDQLAAALEQNVEGVTKSRKTDAGLELHVRGADRLLARVIAAAEAGGFDIADISVNEPTLETVFINLTGKELRD